MAVHEFSLFFVFSFLTASSEPLTTEAPAQSPAIHYLTGRGDYKTNKQSQNIKQGKQPPMF